ncbi:MAG: LysM peptidoglycan-binding domain-containing protein [Deltaproteobacteria bacterium]|nr:MAG: LysM peptidoglycan-binding domain-containing protein [Deltaproteobacteria bacterium]
MYIKTIAGQTANFFAGLAMCDVRCAMWVSHISKQRVLILLTFLITFPYLLAYAVQGKGRDTFSISLVQQATVKKMEGKKVICERYRVKKDDYIWQLLRQRGLLKRPDLLELISLLKGMNKSLTNLDLIHPGQTILIPLNILPVRAYGEREGFFKESMIGISSLRDIDFENYVVKSGDSLTMVAHNRYKVPGEHLYRKYLQLVQKLNPTLEDLDLIYPNQVVRLPIYSPEIVRMPIKPKRVKRASKKTTITPAEDTGQALSLREKLRDIFSQIGEEWIDTGEQFIPLKSGAQIRLKADSFPVLNLTSGRRLIIDIRNELPEDICQLIESDWEDYRIVHLAPGDNLKTVMDKILAAGNYYKILKSGEQFKIGGDIDVSIAGDWVIIPHRGERDITDKIVVISLINNQSEKTPAVVRAYLEKLGINVIDYPDFSTHEDMKEGIHIQKKIKIEKDMDFPLPTLLLDLAGQPFSSQVKIPVYQGESPKFNLIIQADLFFNRNGKDCVIDLTGLSPAILSLLKRHQFLVLSLSDTQDLNRMTELILDFLGLPFDSKPHHLLAAARDETRSIKLTIPGISFHDQGGKRILATNTRMPVEIVSFLNQKGYRILELSQFQDQAQTRGG